MHTAIHHRRRIVSAQNKLRRRIRKELRTRNPDIVVGFQGGHLDPQEVFANNRIWFAHESLENKGIPRYWNALGRGRPVLRRSNNITVEVNPAIHGVNRRVAGLFAVDDKTDHTVLLHRGRIGGGKKDIGKSSFIEWYPGTKVEFIDPSHDYGEESAILVADLDSERFLIPNRGLCRCRAQVQDLAQGRRPDEDLGYRTYKKGRHSSDEAEILHDGRRSLRKEPIRSGTGKTQSGR